MAYLFVKERISKTERDAHFSNGVHLPTIKKKFNDILALELHFKAFRYKNANNLSFFEIYDAVDFDYKSGDGKFIIASIKGIINQYNIMFTYNNNLL